LIHKHQALFVFVDFLVSLAMLAITLLALNGFFSRTVEIRSCQTAPKAAATVAPSPTASASASVAPSASPSGLLKKLNSASPAAAPVKVSE
jgi:hypothetical protein